MIPLADVLIALKWLGALYACSLLGTFVFVKSDNLTLLRYGFGKSVGIIGLGAITWLLSLAKIIPFTALWVWIITLFLFILVIGLRHKTIVKAFKKHWRAYLLIESIFVSLFIIGIIFRSLIPKIEGIEKFMDSAILSNLIRHTKGVPVDTWYAPDHLNYYYFGHWIIAMLAKFSHTALAYAFNLGFASVLAISGTSIFCLVWQLTKRKIAGLLALFLALFASNLHPFLMIIGGEHNYFFFNSGRFIDEVINEYPLYSLILGDLHAHMMALMLSTSFYLLIALIYLKQRSINNLLILSAIAGALVGLMSATNSFDVIASGLIFVLMLALLKYRRRIDNIQIIKTITAFGLAFFVMTLVFLTHFDPAVGGVAVALFKTPLKHIIWQFGLPLLLVLVATIILWRKKIIKSKQKPLDVIFIFGIAGLVLILLPQIIYLKDIYHYQNPPFARANTVFKIWYAAWPLIAIATASLISMAYLALKNKLWQRLLILATVISCAILAFGLYVGISGLKDSSPNTLNGLNYINFTDPAKQDLLNWVNTKINKQPVILQAPGESYTTQSWLSSYSGLPATLGWKSHEWGWRYNNLQWGIINKRSESLKQLYESKDALSLKNQADLLGADYVLVGPEELAIYKIDNAVFIKTFGQPVFGNSRYLIFAVNK